MANEITNGNPSKSKLGTFIEEQGATSVKSLWTGATDHKSLRTTAGIGKPSTNLEKEVKTAVENCYISVSTRLVFTSKRMLPVACKDALPSI